MQKQHPFGKKYSAFFSQTRNPCFSTTRKKIFIYNKRDHRTLLLPSKRTCKQKIQVQVKLQENCTKPKKWKQNKPQPFRVLSAKDKKIHKWWSFEMCAIIKSHELKQHFWHILSQLTLFTTVHLAKRWMVRTGTQWAVFPETCTWTLQSTLKNSRGPRPTLLCLFPPMCLIVWGKWWFILGLFPRAATEQGGLMGRLPCLIWNWCFLIVLWKVRFCRGESSKDIT